MDISSLVYFNNLLLLKVVMESTNGSLFTLTQQKFKIDSAFIKSRQQSYSQSKDEIEKSIFYWWQVWDVGDRFRTLVTDLIHWENLNLVTNISNQSPSYSHQHKDVTNITVTIQVKWKTGNSPRIVA